jgi:regulator of sirC expression with transglutaminase-like and TPR domain
VKELTRLLSARTEDVNLDVAALQVASIEFPALDIAPYLAELDRHAAAISSHMEPSSSGSDYVAAANDYLFGELGFAGNTGDYYNPHNSCLNQVLDLRIGIPITLSVVYIEVARRLGRRVYGIGLPGHFVVQYADARYSTYIDVFDGGRLLTAGGCRDLSKRVSGVDISENPVLLQPVSPRQILMRMLNNLRAIYFQRRAHRKALAVLDLLIVAVPGSPEEYRQRGVLRAEVEQFGGAREDFETYLRLAPDSGDRPGSGASTPPAAIPPGVSQLAAHEII